MCGLVGIVGPISREAMQAAFLAQVARGKDSWGAAWAGSDGVALRIRDVGPVRAEYIDKLPDPASVTYMICHTRAATTGGVSEETAHPFVAHGAAREIILAHNGVIYDHDKADGPVDSQTLAACVAREPGKILLSGWGVALWHPLHGADPTLHVLPVARGHALRYWYQPATGGTMVCSQLENETAYTLGLTEIHRPSAMSAVGHTIRAGMALEPDGLSVEDPPKPPRAAYSGSGQRHYRDIDYGGDEAGLFAGGWDRIWGRRDKAQATARKDPPSKVQPSDRKRATLDRLQAMLRAIDGEGMCWPELWIPHGTEIVKAWDPMRNGYHKITAGIHPRTSWGAGTDKDPATVVTPVTLHDAQGKIRRAEWLIWHPTWGWIGGKMLTEEDEGAEESKPTTIVGGV